MNLSWMWKFLSVILILQGSPTRAMISPISLDDLCDARQFRQAVAEICVYHYRRDVNDRQDLNPYFYRATGVEENPDFYADGHPRISEHRHEAAIQHPSIILVGPTEETDYTSFLNDFYTERVNRYRRVALHEKCCRSTCNHLDFAAIC